MKSRFLALIIMGVLAIANYHFFGFELTVVVILVLIYWAIPIDTKNT